MIDLRLNPALDVAAHADRYRRHGRVRIGDLLVRDDAVRLHDFLDRQDGWWHLINTPDGVIELDRAQRARMGKRRRAALDALVYAGARTGFQYRYEGLRVPDADACDDAAGDPLEAFARLMSSAPMLDMLKQVTGHEAMRFADGHATAYGAGDFLTGHDDDVAGKHRLAAYVFGLTPAWRPEWGGILLFHDNSDGVVSGHVPTFNTLDLFAVPQRHSVSIVTPAAPRRRFAVTGWLRAADDG